MAPPTSDAVALVLCWVQLVSLVLLLGLVITAQVSFNTALLTLSEAVAP